MFSWQMFKPELKCFVIIIIITIITMREVLRVARSWTTGVRFRQGHDILHSPSRPGQLCEDIRRYFLEVKAAWDRGSPLIKVRSWQCVELNFHSHIHGHGAVFKRRDDFACLTYFIIINTSF